MVLGTPRMTLDDIRSRGTVAVTDPEVFSRFAAGLNLTPALLTDGRWNVTGAASSMQAYVDVALHQVFPAFYDPGHLERLGGLFTIQVAGAGHYTLTLFNRRVVTFTGARLDAAGTGPFIDVAILAEVFHAWCNDMVITLCEQTLAAFESDAEAKRVVIYPV